MTARASELSGSPNRLAGPRALGALPVVGCWIAAAFVLSLALAALVLAIAGAGEHGTALALRATARWCFLLFWPAYAGGALARFGGPRFAGLARQGRAFGLAFAAALAVHLGLVLWLMAVAADQRTPMLLFWAGAACTYALALCSLPRIRDRLGPRAWRILSEGAMQYIALVFAVDFIVEPLRANGLGKYPLTYLPFVGMLVGGALLRLAAQIRGRGWQAKWSRTLTGIRDRAPKARGRRGKASCR
jgi:hypothetical protein